MLADFFNRKANDAIMIAEIDVACSPGFRIVYTNETFWVDANIAPLREDASGEATLTSFSQVCEFDSPIDLSVRQMNSLAKGLLAFSCMVFAATTAVAQIVLPGGTTPAPAPGAAPAATADGDLKQQIIIGKWAPSGHCQGLTMQFTADDRLIMKGSPEGSPDGKYVVYSGWIIIVLPNNRASKGPPNSAVLHFEAGNLLHPEDGSLIAIPADVPRIGGPFTRCPG
jgi:hypothetical protein